MSLFINKPKIVGDDWFNSKPLNEDDLADKVVLVDFWTYSCVNCLRTLKYLRLWWNRYKDMRFLIIGIHSPEFEFEKNPLYVRRAIKDLKIDWPVVLDNQYINWNNFANHYWPAKYLIDNLGKIVYTHFGEGAYSETEKEIQKLIRKNLGDIHLPDIEETEHLHSRVCFRPTPEIYCGYGRGVISNYSGYQRDRAEYYDLPNELRVDSIALAGKFYASNEFVEPAEIGSALLLRFRATEVNLVMSVSENTAAAEITLDGQPPETDIRGRDLTGNGEVIIEKPVMYNLIKSDHLVEGILSIRSKMGKFRAYAFTFSGCEL